ERLGLRRTATTRAVVREGCSRGPRDRRAVGVGERDRADDAIRAVARDLDLGRARLVDLCACLDAVDREAQGARGAGAGGADDLVHAPAARGHERLAPSMKHLAQAVAAEAGMGASAAIVEDGHLLAD